MNFLYASIAVTILSLGLLRILIPEIWKRKSILFGIIFLTVPTSTLVNLFVKRQIIYFLTNMFEVNMTISEWPLKLLIITLFVAPIIEELIKIYPLLIKKVKKLKNTVLNVFQLGYLLGFGFGIGEIWYLAYGFTIQHPELASGPFLIFGFLGERFMAVFIHAYLTATFLHYISKNKFARGYLIVILLHSLINLGAMVYQAKLYPENIVILFFIPSIVLFLVFCFKVEKKYKLNPISEERILFKK